VTHKFSMRDFAQAYEVFISGASGKIMFTP